jgi:hypothetical protein
MLPVRANGGGGPFIQRSTQFAETSSPTAVYDMPYQRTPPLYDVQNSVYHAKLIV